MCLDKTERANFLRYFCLFIDIGTDTLLQLFLHFVHPETVVAFFSSDAVRKKCQELCDRTVLSQKQLSIVKHSCPDIFSFDISLLIALLSNLFTGKIAPPKNGWQTNKPRRDDLSVAADIVRLRLMRNEVVGHSSRAKLSDGYFHELWGKLETIVLRLYSFLKPDSTCDIRKQIDYYKTMTLDEQRERHYQEKLKILQDACIEIVEIQDKAADLLQKSLEFEQFFRTKPQRFSLYIRLLLDGGRLVLTAHLQTELSKCNLSIQEVILEKRDVLEKYTGDAETIQHLNEAVDKWDIRDLATVILVCFGDTVTPRIKEAITGIQDAFTGYARLAFVSLDADKFSDIYVDLVNNLRRLSLYLGSDIESKCEEIIETYRRKKQETEPDTDDEFDLIKSHRVKMKSLEDVYKDTLIQLKKVITELEEKGIPFKQDYVLQLQLMTYGERKTLVEDILATVFTAVLRNEESTNGSEDISEATHLFLDQINNIPGVKVESVERHCILISITCSSSQGLLKLIEYVESTLFQEMLYKLSTDLMAHFGEVLVVTGNFNFESLHDLDNFLSSCSAPEHKPGGLTLNVACSSVEGINQVVRLMKADTTKHNVKQIAEHLSEQVQENVSLQINFPDLQHFLREVGDNGSSLSSSQHETAQPDPFVTNEDKDTTSPKKKSEGFGEQDMASNQPADTNTPPRCFRHHKTWQSNVQWTLNKLRDRLIPKLYLGRFNNLLCTCSRQNPYIASVWDEVTDNHLQESVAFINQHIVQNPYNENVAILKHVVKLLCQDKEINKENRTDIKVAPRSSALKFLYLLRKAIEKDFKIMEPRKPKALIKKKAKKKIEEEQKLEVELNEYPPELLGQLIGDRGRNIMMFMKREKCYVHLVKGTSVSGQATVMATIKKTTTNRHILTVIAEELRRYAKDTRESVESYQPADREQFTPEVKAVYDQIDEMNMDEVREEYFELLEAMESVTATSTFNDVGQYYKDNNNTRFNAVTKKLSLVNQIRAFEEYKTRIIQAPQTPTGITNIRSQSLGQQKSQSRGQTVLESCGASASTSQVSKNPEETDAKRCKKI